MSAEERTGWRDRELSMRHRDWGDDCPFCDVDCFVGAEYDHEKPVAIIDYKCKPSPPKADSNQRLLINLANKASIGFFLVLYCQPPWEFRVLPKNEIASQIVDAYGLTAWWINELSYVQFLYHLRGRDMPPEVSQFIQKPI